jgi:ABC-type spermidine/putrescine transport system permease subunit I
MARQHVVASRNWELITQALPVILLQAAFFIVPLVLAFVLTFQASKFYQLQWTWDLATWAEVFSKWYYWGVLLRTSIMAAITLLICVVISLPVAYAVVTRIPQFDGHFKAIIIIVFVTDAVLKTYGGVIFLDERGVLNAALALIGFEPQATHLIYTRSATIIGMVYNLLPFMIFTIYLSMNNIDRDLIRAAYDAGASKLRTFWEVTLPLCRPGVWAGSILVYVLSLGAFLEPKVLGGGNYPMEAEIIRQTFETRVNWPLGAAITVVLILTSVLFVLLFSWIYGTSAGGKRT